MKEKKTCSLKARLAIISLFLEYAQAQGGTCNYTLNMTPGETYYIYNPGFSQSYNGGLQCRWIATSPAHYYIRVECPIMDMPKSPLCSIDKLMISRTGDPQLTSAQRFCGDDPVKGIVTTGQQLSMGLMSSYNSPGGRICCKLTTQSARPPILEVEIKILDLPSTCNCGYRRMNRMVNAEETQPNEFTMMAALFSTSGDFICSGVIISNKHILTSAYCVYEALASNILVVVGEHDFRTSAESNHTQGFVADSIIVHPDYDEVTLDNNIAIIKLRDTITFNQYVGPVCLPFKYAATSFAGEPAIMLGWGAQEFGGARSNILQMINATIISQSQCQAIYSNITSSKLCTSDVNGGPCQGDSGGPVLHTNSTSGRLFSVGVISMGISCGYPDFPSENTRVTSYLDFILTNAPYDYCII